MSTKTSVDTIWHIPDDLWSMISPILGPEKQPGTRGRKRIAFDAIVVTAANTHDKVVALATLNSIIVERPEKLIYRIHHLCLDKGYDYEDAIAGVLVRD